MCVTCGAVNAVSTEGRWYNKCFQQDCILSTERVNAMYRGTVVTLLQMLRQLNTN